MSRASWLLAATVPIALAAVAGAAPAAGTATPETSGPTAALAADAVAWLLEGPEYEGPRAGCRRCHIRQYRSWQRTPHAHAYETLPEEERNNGECLRCHITGWGKPTGFTSIEDSAHLAAVTCEVCHGPGSLYKDKETMQDRDASVAAGLLIPDEQTCRSCHNPDSPTFPGSFNYEEMLEKGVHEREDS